MNHRSRRTAQGRIAIRASAFAVTALAAVVIIFMAFPAELGITQSKGKYTNKTIQKKERELNNLKAEIKKYEKKLAESKSLERNTLDRIDDIGKQTGLLRRFINRLNDRINDYQREIEIAQDGLEEAELRLTSLQQAYSDYIVSMYKRGRTHDTELLLSSASINQMLIRSQYMKALTRTNRVEAEEIRLAKRAIEIQKSILEARLKQQLEAREEKTKEQNRLQNREREHKTLLTRARNDKALHQKHLQRKQAAAAKVERLVANLIAKEREKAAAKRGGSTAAKGGLMDLPTTPVSMTAFGKLRGRLPWPVSRGRIVEEFGERVNAEHNLRFVNNGIDIQVAEGTSVHSVADGEVMGIDFIPGYGDIIMINHGDDFVTIYAHIKSISVKTGQKIKAGQNIGKSGVGVSGSLIRFELWRPPNTFNPLTWLAPR